MFYDMGATSTVATIVGKCDHIIMYIYLYKDQINACALIGKSAMVYCANKLMQKSCFF